jgi:hypothetical protein
MAQSSARRSAGGIWAAGKGLGRFIGRPCIWLTRVKCRRDRPNGTNEVTMSLKNLFAELEVFAEGCA